MPASLTAQRAPARTRGSDESPRPPLQPGELYVLHGRDDLTYLHCARFLRRSDVQTYGVPEELVGAGSVRLAWVLRMGATMAHVHAAPDRRWAHAPEDAGIIARTAAVVQRHHEALRLGASARAIVRTAAPALSPEEEAERARAARALVKEAARLRMRQWIQSGTRGHARG